MNSVIYCWIRNLRADRVIIEGIYQICLKDSMVKKLKKYAQDNSREKFDKSPFPDNFRDIVT